ncbi:MAG: amino acid permease [Crocinitomicaceae bacterium]|jgi:APA family basic amino acid/polyamine antiporter
MISQLLRKKSINQIQKDVEKNNSEGKLGRHLKLKDLTSLGIAAIIGAGIFSTIGNASYSGGPAVILLFIFTAIACGFAAFAYAEFAALVPVSGSAYTYAYVAFGEIVAWIIGWALIMEYAVGNITVAISWSDYFTTLLSKMHIDIPAWMQIDYLSAKKGFLEFLSLKKNNIQIDENDLVAFKAWKDAPQVFGMRMIGDLPALLIIFLITYLVYRGIKESKRASNLMVLIKLLIILLVLIVGVFYVDVQNWNPFSPNGLGGVLKGVSAVFFAYIGFDAISTTAEECENPKKDLPKAMMWSIIVCTILYILIALVLTGMVKYDSLNVGDPLAFVFEKLNIRWMSGIIAVSAVIAMASVLLVFQMGQPRIWMSMSRDGLLPSAFSKIHPKFKTPSFATVVTGFIVGIPALFMNLTIVTDLCSIGTLFAFVLVCGGVVVLHGRKKEPIKPIVTPFIDSKLILILLFVSMIGLFHFYFKWIEIPISLLILVFIISIFIVISFFYKLSAIPLLGLLSCFYMMTELNISNWIGFGIWMLIGLVVYFTYGIKNSRLKQDKKV